MPAAIAYFVPALLMPHADDAAPSHSTRSACPGSTPPGHATSTSNRHPPTPASSATSSVSDASQLPDTLAPRLRPFASTRPSPSPEQLLDLSLVEPYKNRNLSVPNRCEPMTIDFTTESAQDWTAFHSACTALFGADFDPAEPFDDIRLMMKREEQFSHCVSKGSKDKRHATLPSWRRSEIKSQLLTVTANKKIKRDLIYQAIAYLDMVLARSINIPREVHWELIMACLLMGDEAKNDDYVRDKGKNLIYEIARLKQVELQYEYNGDVFSNKTRNQLILTFGNQFDWNLHCDSLYDWVMLYLRNYSALLHEDAAEFRQDKTPSLYYGVFLSAFLLMDYAVMSEELSALPYSVVAAGIVKAVTEDLEQERGVVNASLRYTGYTDKQLMLVTQCLHGDPELAGYYNVQSDNKDIYVHSTWFLPNDDEAEEESEDESKWSVPYRGYEADLPPPLPGLFDGLALLPVKTVAPEAPAAEAVFVYAAVEEAPVVSNVSPAVELEFFELPSEEELAALTAAFLASDRYIYDMDMCFL
ncbi:hypothetical protein HDU80_008843 [Chytriomyces hyalinus]|nr:hypothetical protein HDU80_008843 [Chytriomyces hyalinus]